MTIRALSSFDPENVNLNTADPVEIVCYMSGVGNAQPDSQINIGSRIIAIVILFVVSTAVTVFPIVATRVRWLKIPTYGLHFARYFGTGIIISTGFVHLLTPAFDAIGPDTCVGMTGGWASFSWPPAIVLASVMVVFLMDFFADRFVETHYGLPHHVPHHVTTKAMSSKGLQTMQEGKEDVDSCVVSPVNNLQGAGNLRVEERETCSGQDVTNVGCPDALVLSCSSVPRPIHEFTVHNIESATRTRQLSNITEHGYEGPDIGKCVQYSDNARVPFSKQITAFLVLEFGVIVHSVIIGINLGVVEQQFWLLVGVITVHQAFEGLGIGARMVSIPFPKKFYWLPWTLALIYGVTTPLSVGIGVGIRTVYSPQSYAANVVSGVLYSISAGMLIYTGVVELLVRDFLFNPERTSDNKELTFMLFNVFLGAAVMSLLAKWA